MNVVEKVSYVSDLLAEHSNEIKAYAPSVKEVYVEKDYFGDDFDLGKVPAELIFTVGSEEDKRNSFPSSLSTLYFRYFVLSFITVGEFSNPRYNGYSKVFTFEQN